MLYMHKHNIQNIQNNSASIHTMATQKKLPQNVRGQNSTHCKLQKYLKQKPHKPPCLLPLFKCFSPPQYNLIKNLSVLHSVSPRFIALCHQTHCNSLVRAQLRPTDEQLTDIELTLLLTLKVQNSNT